MNYNYNGSQFRIIKYTWQISSNIILEDGKCISQNYLKFGMYTLNSFYLNKIHYHISY